MIGYIEDLELINVSDILSGVSLNSSVVSYEVGRISELLILEMLFHSQQMNDLWMQVRQQVSKRMGHYEKVSTKLRRIDLGVQFTLVEFR